jgi:YceI-like domain
MIRISWLLVSHLAAVIVILAGPDQPGQAIDTERSSLTVHVGKAGLLSAAAHEHWVNAPIAGGAIAADGSTPPGGSLSMLAGFQSGPKRGSLTKSEPRCNPTCRAKSWNQMYPDIVFRSTEVRRTGAVVWGVSGDLALHGVPFSVEVARQNDAYLGTVRIKQTEFGIGRSRSAAVLSG